MPIKKTTRIILPMLISGLLLILFIFRWLQTEYNGEKEQLQKNLFGQFIEAKSRLTDSLISSHLVVPIMKGPSTYHMEKSDSSLQYFVRKDDSGQIMQQEIRGEEILHNNLPNIPCDTTFPEQFKVKIETTIDDSDVLYSGVKMFIMKAKGMHGEDEIFRRYSNPSDTLLLQHFFAENLAKNHLPVQAEWARTNIPDTIPPPPFYFESHLFDYSYGVRIIDYSGYLFKKIFPEILFSFVLILITLTAFIFSYRSLDRQVRLAALKDDFISNMSHELKTPVATVKVALEAMQNMLSENDTAKMKNYLGMAQQEITRLEMLVNKVMNSILLENEKQIFQPERINFVSIVEETAHTMRPQLEKYHAEIKINTESSDMPILSDAMHIKSILYNLIDNSLKYGNESPRIEINLRQDQDNIVLSFSDNGPGIPDEYIARIFEKFFRVPHGNQHTIKGYGLGLYYVNQVMQQLGGSISVKNNPSAGCTFTLRFPAER